MITPEFTWPHALDVRILGLTGEHCAGKDTCALALVRHGYRQIAFADALRHEVMAAFHVDALELTNRHTKEVPSPALCIVRCLDQAFVELSISKGWDLKVPRSARWILQRWGTEYRREADPDYWTNKVRARILSMVGYGWRNFVITDVIFHNEEDVLRRMGGKLVRVHRPELQSALAAETVAHASRLVPLLPVDGDIVNDGSLAALAQKTEQAVAGLFGVDALYPFIQQEVRDAA